MKLPEELVEMLGELSPSLAKSLRKIEQMQEQRAQVAMHMALINKLNPDGGTSTTITAKELKRVMEDSKEVVIANRELPNGDVEMRYFTGEDMGDRAREWQAEFKEVCEDCGERHITPERDSKKKKCDCCD